LLVRLPPTVPNPEMVVLMPSARELAEKTSNGRKIAFAIAGVGE